MVAPLNESQSLNNDPFAYLEGAQFVLQIDLLIQELLESVGEDDVCVVESAVLLVELVILVAVRGGTCLVRDSCG